MLSGWEFYRYLGISNQVVNVIFMAVSIRAAYAIAICRSNKKTLVNVFLKNFCNLLVVST